MTLEIVWRNPAALPKTESRLERLVIDELAAVYAIRCSNETRLFELLPGRAA